MTTASKVISVAHEEVGYREKATNHTKYADQVSALHWAQNQPWCHTFITWVFQVAGARELAPVTASCATGAAWFKKLHHFYETPKVGDIVYYGPSGGTHVELVIEVTADRIKTIGGNTSGSLSGHYYNGDGVYEKWVDRDENRIYGYGRPQYTAEPKKAPAKPLLKLGSKGTAVKNWQKALNENGFKVAVDGEFGPLTEKATKGFQAKNKIEVDGVVGPVTYGKA